jgi:hypothetical protein
MSKRASLLAMMLLALILVLASSSVASADDDHARLLTARLTGAAEVPGPADSDGEGQAWIVLFPEQGQVCFTLTVERVEPLTAAHIHVAARGQAGPVVVPLTPLAPSGASAGCVSAEAQLIRAIRQHPSAYYVNVHNLPFPGGALRGQLHPLND